MGNPKEIQQTDPWSCYTWIVEVDGSVRELTNLTDQDKKLLYLLKLEEEREGVVGSWAHTGAVNISQDLYLKLSAELREIRAEIDNTIKEMQ